MPVDLLPIQIHLWILTALVALMIGANVYLNLLKRKNKKDDPHFEYMTYLLEAGKNDELLEYTTDYLRVRPSHELTLFFDAQVKLRLEDFDGSLASARKLSKSSYIWSDEAEELIKAIKKAAGGS